MTTEEKIETNNEVSVKKKRGRPRKKSKEFQQYIIDIFSDYIDTNKSIIESFINIDNRISSDLWYSIYDHITQIEKKLNEYINVYRKDYHYKPDSIWKPIDTYRESQRKQYIKFFYESDQDIIYRSYLIYTHFKVYISESSKEAIL